MTIERTRFGSITIDGRTYDHDVVIALSGEVAKRRKALSKAKYGTSHIVSKAEAKAVFEKGCQVLVVGTGQDGRLCLSPEAEAYLEAKACRVVARPTPEALASFNKAAGRKIALMHVTC
jgi:hypothetical protein